MNEHHQRCISTTLRHIHGCFAEIEGILTAIGNDSPLSQYVLDLQPMQRRIIEDYLHRIREEMVAAMKRLGICLDGRRTSAAWAIRSRLLGISINLAEMDPQHLRGYGRLSPEDQDKIARVYGELERLVGRLDAYLVRARDEDPAQRLARLEKSPAHPGLLTILEQIVTRHHLLEFRPMLDVILSRLESTEFEIAFFGRVSSGKSSLLNHVLTSRILPVGVTPITAVPTRIRHGPNATMVVCFELSVPQQLPVERIGDFVTEEGNPHNTKHVNEVEVFLPSAPLAEGVVFVDTPGIGSLATCGAAQTMAYLPRCDLGIVLLDAGSTLNHEDLGILRGFHEAAIPTCLVLSKCDLLDSGDRARVVKYIEEQVNQNLGLTVKVCPVSIVGENRILADQWFAEQVRPLLQDHQKAVEASIQRKIANFRESITATLNWLVICERGGVGSPRDTDTNAARKLLEEAAERIAGVSAKIVEPLDTGLSEIVDQIIEQTAVLATQRTPRSWINANPLAQATGDALAGMAAAARMEFVELGRSLSRTVEKVAVILGRVADHDPEDAVTSLGPLPAFEEKILAELPLVRVPSLVACWPAAGRLLALRRARRQGQWAIHSLLRNHRDKLRKWTKSNLESLICEYEALIEPYRAQLRQPRPDEETRQAVDLDGLQADVEALAAFSSSTPAPSSPPASLCRVECA